MHDRDKLPTLKDRDRLLSSAEQLGVKLKASRGRAEHFLQAKQMWKLERQTMASQLEQCRAELLDAKSKLFDLSTRADSANRINVEQSSL